MSKVTKTWKITQESMYNYSIVLTCEKKDLLLNSIISNNSLKDSLLNNNSINFTAKSVEGLNDFLLKQVNSKLTNIQCIELLKTITKQIKYLESINQVFYGLNIADIVVIDGVNYQIVSSNNLIEKEKNNITFYCPFNQCNFSSPELLELKKLPSSIDYRCSYYSLGGLLLFCHLKKELLVDKKIPSEIEIEYLLESIYDTNIYWFLKRCLVKDIQKRVLLLV